MKRALSLFLILAALTSGVSFAQVLDTGKDGVVLPVIIPNFSGSEKEDVIEFVEVKEDNTVTIDQQNVNTIGTYQAPRPVVKTYQAPVRQYVQEVKRKPIKQYVRLYGQQYFSPLYSEARVYDWAEFRQEVPRSFYSDSQRSSRVNAMYGKVSRLRYYPALKTPTQQLAGVFEHDARLLTQ